MKKLFCILFLALSLPLLAGRTWYAPDLASSEDRLAWLGVVNNKTAAQTITITGYAADGLVLGDVAVDLVPGQRYEVAAHNLFADSEPLAWASVTSAESLVGYVRYNHQGAISMVPLTSFAGPDLYLPAITETGQDSQLVMVNTSAQTGEALSAPQRYYPYNFNAATLQEPVSLMGFGTPKSQLRATYADLVTGVKQGMLWDHLQSNLPMVGVQHFSKEDGSSYGSLVPALTPLREMIIAPLAPATRGYKTRFVIANTTEQILHATLTIRDEMIAEPWDVELELAAGEKRTYTFGDPTQLPQFKPIWFHLKANENGLVGYQYTEATNGGACAYTEGRGEPGSRVVLPYVRQDNSYATRINLINPTAGNAAYAISGFAEDGSKVGSWYPPTFASGKAASYSLDEMFGTEASSVAWLEVHASLGKVSLMGLVYARDGSTMGCLTGTPTSFKRDERMIADFEFGRAIELQPQGWKAQLFNDQIPRVLFRESGRLDDGLENPIDGSFFIESAFLAASRHHFVGYEPRLASKSEIIGTQQEELALVSPFVEVPDYAQCFLNFSLRLINPEFGADDSRYGIAWRIEGSDDWQWFGLTGEQLQNPPDLIADCWEPVCYRTHKNEVTLTPWFNFQMPLPASVEGKRIQVGLFYNHVHTLTNAVTGPTLFVDGISLSSKAKEHAFFYEASSGSVWPVAETVEPVEIVPE